MSENVRLQDPGNDEYPKGCYGFEKKRGKYYLWCCGVRFQVSKETWEKEKKRKQ